MDVFDLPPGFPNAQVNEQLVDDLVTKNAAMLDIMLDSSSVWQTGIDLVLPPGQDDTALAGSIRTLERFRTFVGDSSVEQSTYAHPDSHDTEVFWEIPSYGGRSRAYVTEKHLRNEQGILTSVSAKVGATKPIRYQELLRKAPELTELKPPESFGAKLRKFGKATMNSPSGWFIYPGAAYLLYRQNRAAYRHLRQPKRKK